MVNIQRTFILACSILVLVFPCASVAESTVEGVWLNGDGDGWIELIIIDGELSGRIIGSPDDPLNEKPSRLDLENPHEALHSRPVLGLTILTGFRADGDGRWTGGRVYDPNSGNTYRGTISVIGSDTLKLRGFIGISLFGRTEVWKRRSKID